MKIIGHKNLFKSILVALILINALGPGCNRVAEEEVYLFSYFKKNGEDGLHLAWSGDGLKFTPLNGDAAILAPKVSADMLMRDPCIIQGDDGIFRMVWTVSWNAKGIGYAWSKDLLEWSEQKYLPVMEHEPEARNCWAPEVFYDAATGLYLIFWSTTIPGRNPETEAMADKGWDHRMYYVTTRDFEKFSETRLFYDAGFNVIDGTLLAHDSRYFLFLKDETRYPPQKNIRMAVSAQVEGPSSAAGEPITGDYWAEGPTVAKAGEKWVVYFDKYMEHAMGAVSSTDLVSWTDMSDEVSFPDGTRHGTILRVKRKILDRLLERYP